MVVFYLDSTSNHNCIAECIIISCVVFYLDSTSNHNLMGVMSIMPEVVFYLDSTSNHNPVTPNLPYSWLYFIWILHQTTTACWNSAVKRWLYFIWILHQTTTTCVKRSINHVLYFIWILHQTTTGDFRTTLKQCCILFGFYIKPQPRTLYSLISCVLHAFVALKNQPFHSGEVDLMRFFQSYRISKNKYN